MLSRSVSGSVSMDSMGSWEPISFWAVGYGTHQSLEEATKFTENSVKNGVFVTMPYSYPKSCAGKLLFY